MRCEKCGKEIQNLLINHFNYDGSDSHEWAGYTEEETDAVVFETDNNWTGYELTEEEQKETIECPHCHQFPFIHDEIQVYDIVRVVCFKSPKGAKE